MKKKYIVILIIIVLLIGIRISLPFIALKYANKVLSEIPGYRGHITDVDICLIRGAYTIDSLTLDKIEGDQPVPFFSTTQIDLSVHWGALFHGNIVGEIIFEKPQVNFVASQDTADSQYGEDVDWTEPIKDLIPLQINLFTINNGEIHFRNFSSEPPVDVYLSNLQVQATNLSNAKDVGQTLPSHLALSATSVGNGKLSLEGDMNILKKIPDIDLDLKFESVDITALNDFLRAYANVDAEQGVFNLYAEFLTVDGQVDGYVKPLITDLTILDSDEEGTFLNKAWQGVVGTVMEIFENQPKDQFATKVPLNGNLNDTEAGILPGVWNIFKNAFVEAFKRNTDNTIDFGSTSSPDE